MKLFVWANSDYDFESYAVMAENLADAEKAMIEHKDATYLGGVPHKVSDLYEDHKLLTADINEVIQIDTFNP